MSTALVSAMSGRPVRKDVSMTGEITLRGRVLPIGGVKEKVLGAHRAGIKHIILPKDNEADIEDIPDEVRKQLSFHTVSTLDEVFKIALLPAPNKAPSASVSPTLMEEMEGKPAGRAKKAVAT
jgi:ATP-dependent Lon protease